MLNYPKLWPYGNVTNKMSEKRKEKSLRWENIREVDHGTFPPWSSLLSSRGMGPITTVVYRIILSPPPQIVDKRNQTYSSTLFWIRFKLILSFFDLPSCVSEELDHRSDDMQHSLIEQPIDLASTERRIPATE